MATVSVDQHRHRRELGERPSIVGKVFTDANGNGQFDSRRAGRRGPDRVSQQRRQRRTPTPTIPRRPRLPMATYAFQKMLAIIQIRAVRSALHEYVEHFSSSRSNAWTAMSFTASSMGSIELDMASDLAAIDAETKVDLSKTRQSERRSCRATGK